MLIIPWRIIYKIGNNLFQELLLISKLLIRINECQHFTCTGPSLQRVGRGTQNFKISIVHNLY